MKPFSKMDFGLKNILRPWKRDKKLIEFCTTVSGENMRLNWELEKMKVENHFLKTKVNTLWDEHLKAKFNIKTGGVNDTF